MEGMGNLFPYEVSGIIFSEELGLFLFHLPFLWPSGGGESAIMLMTSTLTLSTSFTPS